MSSQTEPLDKKETPREGQNVPGIDRLAEVYGFDRGDLDSFERFSSRRALRFDKSDSASRGFNSIEHRRGPRRRTTSDFLRHLSIAYGSLLETETQLLIAQRLKYLTRTKVNEAMMQTSEVGRLLNGLMTSLTR